MQEKKMKGELVINHFGSTYDWEVELSENVSVVSWFDFKTEKAARKDALKWIIKLGLVVEEVIKI